MAQVWELAAWQIAELVAAGEISAREVVQAHLDRIETVNPKVNAVTAVLADSALAAADTAAGPLCGVPFTVKENIDVAGSATTQGIAALRDATAVQDAPHIAALRAAGAIPIGRTNMPEFGMRWHTDNALHGVTRNPRSPDLTPGGSSGGDAAAVAARMVPLGMGNDGAGSLRWPAQCCGTAALKPSLGRVAQTGQRGPIPFAFQLLAVHGPIARHVQDLRLAFEQMRVPAGTDPWHVPVPFDGPPLPKRVSLVVTEDVHPEIAATLQQAAEMLTDAGYRVEPSQAPDLVRANEIYTQLMYRYGRVHSAPPPVETLASGEFVRFWQAFDPVWTAAAGAPAFDPMMERASIAQAWQEWMAPAPLVLAPIRAQPAFPVGADLDPDWLAGWPASMRMTFAVNLLGLPAVAVPAGEHVVQIIGPRFREDLCLTAAAAIEARSPVPPVNLPVPHLD
jgi:amidase